MELSTFQDELADIPKKMASSAPTIYVHLQVRNNGSLENYRILVELYKKSRAISGPVFVSIGAKFIFLPQYQRQERLVIRHVECLRHSNGWIKYLIAGLLRYEGAGSAAAQQASPRFWSMASLPGKP